MLFLDIFVLCRKAFIQQITVFLLWISVLLTFTGRAVCTDRHSLLFRITVDAICISTCHFILLSTYRLTAVFTQYQQFQSCQHTVCCRWCCQADCCHRLLTLILLCIYTILRHTMNILTVNMHWQTAVDIQFSVYSYL